MYNVCILTYYLPERLPNRVPYIPSMVDSDSMSDNSACDRLPSPNMVVWAGRIAAETLDRWLADSEIMVMWYEEVVDGVQ